MTGFPEFQSYLLENGGLGPKINPELLATINLYTVGDIGFFAQTAGELKPFWYVCTGDKWGVTTPQGLALLSLSLPYRTNWGITESAGLINVPKLFDEQGRGYLPRAVDGVNRQPGSVQGDAIRNIQTQHHNSYRIDKVRTNYNSDGPIYAAGTQASNYAFCGCSNDFDIMWLGFDASLVVPTADENRPINVGLTPAIYLGV
jgi:hypothetical protein